MIDERDAGKEYFRDDPRVIAITRLVGSGTTELLIGALEESGGTRWRQRELVGTFESSLERLQKGEGGDR